MNRPAYPKYKPSGVDWLGEVPEHWEVKRGRFLMQVNPASDVLRKLTPETEISFVPMDAVGEYGGLRLDDTRALGDVGAGYTEFQDGDVVVAKITPCFENGKGALALKLVNRAASGTTELHVLRASRDYDRRYLFYWTISPTFRRCGEAEMYGAGGQKRVPPEFCKNFGYSSPPLPEQRAIADFLDRETSRLDRLVAKKRELIARLKERRAALITRAVTRGLDPAAKLKDSDVEWLGMVPEGWEVQRFSRVARVEEGQVDPEVEPYVDMILIAPNHVESGTGILLYKETAAEQAAESGKYRCRVGDVIYSKIRPALAKVAMAEEDCLCSADMYPIRGGHNLANKYLYWSMLSRWFIEWSTLESARVAMPKINRETLGACKIPLPPLAEQRAIADYLDRETGKLDRLTASVEAAIERLQEYRAALITAAVTGKIDVREGTA